MPPELLTAEAAEVRHLRQSVESRIRRLRGMVDRIEREAEQRIRLAERGQGRYSAVAETFIRETAWGVADASIESLASTAASADEYRTASRGTWSVRAWRLSRPIAGRPVRSWTRLT